MADPAAIRPLDHGGLLVVDDEPFLRDAVAASLRFLGFEVMTRLRREGCQVPVIFLTAKDTQEDKVTGLTLGGDDYLTKPFGLEELAARIRTVLRRTRPAASGPVLAFA